MTRPNRPLLCIAALALLLSGGAAVPDPITLDPAADWIATLEDAPDGAEVRFGPGVYIATRTVVLQNMADVRIVGAGPRTTLYLPAHLQFGFELRGPLRGVTLERLTLVGGLRSHAQANAAAGNVPDPGWQVRNTHAIGMFSGASGIAGLVLRDLAIRDVAVGIGLAGQTRDVLVTGCRIQDCYGTVSGRGYGIVSQDVTHLVLAGNTVARCGRHAIYIARGPGPTWVEGNDLPDHRVGTVPQPYFMPAIAVARSANVVVRGNRIVRTHDAAISCERDDADAATPVTGLVVAANVFRDSRSSAPYLWINTGDGAEPVIVAENLFDLATRDVLVTSGAVTTPDDPEPEPPTP